MRAFLIPFAVTIAGNVLYHLSQKSVPRGVHPTVALGTSYIVAFIVTMTLLPFIAPPASIAESFRRLNWASITTGLAIAAVEAGYLLAYRYGLNVSMGSLASNAAVALILLPAGVLLFRERITVANGVGVILCMTGLVLILRR